MARGKFITLEGGEGAGKSTQAKNLVACLERYGHESIATREVGGSPGAEEIRELWLSKGEGFWDPMTEVMLIMAARREHLVQTIWPALEKGIWVVCDRFVDSTRAYQGIGLGLGLEKIDVIYQQIAGDFTPDLTLFLDVPVKVGLQRMAARRGPDDRYQQRNEVFHEKLRAAYAMLAEQDKQRIQIIDAAQEAVQVTSAIEAVVAKRFKL